MWDATIQKEAISYISSYQTLTANKNSEKLLSNDKAHYKSGRIYAIIVVKLLR